MSRRGRSDDLGNRFEMVFDNSLVGILVVDADRHIIEINPRACEIFGYRADELLGESAQILHLSEAAFQRFGQDVFERIRSTGVADVRYDLKRANGEVFQAALSGRPFNGVDRSGGVIWVVADVSQTSRAEQALRTSEERFALAVAGSNEGIWDWDVTTNQIYFSPRWKELIGYAEHEIDHRFEEWATRVHPEDLPAANAAIQAHLRGETALLETEFRMRCKDGSWRWILGRGLCVRDAAGRPLRMAGSHSDIDARRRAEDEVREHEAHLAAVLNTVQTGIVVIDHQQHLVVDANDLAARILGLAREELINSPCAGRLCLASEECPYARGTPVTWQAVTNQEAVFTRADGSEVSVLKSSVPLQLHGRDLLVESFVDITDIKQTEAALRRAKQEAESAAIAKSEFLAKMSHEIRTPMNSILGLTKLTLDTELTLEQRENLQMVDASAEGLLALIDDILDFSQLEGDGAAFEPVDFDLSALFEEVLDGFALRAAEKGLELIEFIDPQVPLGLRGDVQRLRQVLVNLLGNAIKFTAHGDVVLSVAAALESDLPPVADLTDGAGSTCWLRFSVRDSGPGVESGKQAEIFLPFQQADNSATRRFGGSGLGLSISRQIVELMGGRIDLNSAAGQGSEFWFSLPLQCARRAPVSDSLVPLAVRGLRCLVVDDHAPCGYWLEKTLKGWGCLVRAVASGAEALAALELAHAAGEPFRLVMLDLHMPEMDGEQTARAIRQQPAWGDPDIIFLASAKERAGVSRLHTLGVLALLTKPVKHRQLARVLGQALAGSDAVPMPPAPAQSAISGPDFSGAQVLLVEDRPFNRRVATSYLQRHGVRVTTAENGLHALALTRTRAFDLILMDVQMPFMDGCQVAIAIRDEPDHPNRNSPILAMSALAQEGERERCMRAGMDDYLTKPLRLDLLEQALTRWLGGGGARERAPQASGSTDSHPIAALGLGEIKRGVGDIDHGCERV